MSIWSRSVFMPHYFIPSLRSFCLLKVAHLFNCVSLPVLSGFLGDLDSALSVISLSFPYPSFLSSLRVSLGILFSSLFGISLSSSFDPLSPLSLFGLLLPFPSPLPFSTLLSLRLPSLFFPSFESAWAYCSARSLEFFSFLLFLSLSPLSFAASSLLLAPSSPSSPYPPLPPSPFSSCVPSESSLWHIAQLAPYSCFSLLIFSPLDPPGHIVRFILRVSPSPFSSPFLPPLLPSLPSSSSPRSQPGHIVRLAASLLSRSRISSLLPPFLPHSPVSFFSQCRLTLLILRNG